MPAMLTLKSRKCCAYGLDAAVEGFHVLRSCGRLLIAVLPIRCAIKLAEHVENP
jgi:hypothetical protein